MSTAERPPTHGTYLFADYCGGDVWGLIRNDDGTWTRLRPVQPIPLLLRRRLAGELYIVDLQGALSNRLLVAPGYSI